MEMKLTIRRVPTVVSNYQEDADKPRAGCGRNCLGDCCLPGEPPTPLDNSLLTVNLTSFPSTIRLKILGILTTLVFVLDPVPF